MGRLIFTLILSALSAWVYVNYVKPGDESVQSAFASKDESITKLSQFTDGNIAAILSPIAGKAANSGFHEIRQIRASILASKAKAAAQDQPTYVNAIALCDTLAEAVQEREQCNRSLIDTRSKPYHSSTAFDPAKEEQEKRKFFEGGIHHRWAERAASYQRRVNALYRILSAQRR